MDAHRFHRFIRLCCYANASSEMWKESGKDQAWSCLLQRMRRCGRPIDTQQHSLWVWQIYADKTFQPKASYQNVSFPPYICVNSVVAQVIISAFRS